MEKKKEDIRRKSFLSLKVFRENERKNKIGKGKYLFFAKKFLPLCVRYLQKKRGK